MSFRVNLLAGCISLFLIVLISCSKKDDNATPTPTPTPITTVEGTYKVTSGTITPGFLGVTDLVSLGAVYTGGNCLTEASLTFNMNGTITNSNPASCQTPSATNLITTLGIGNGSKWSYVASTKTLTIIYGTNQSRTVAVSFSGQTMILTGTLTSNPIDNTPGNFSYILTLTRQ